MITRQTSLSRNVIEFCRFIRNENFSVSLQEEIIALKSLTFLNWDNSENFKLALKTVLCKSKAELQAFDYLFELYWKEREKAIDSKIQKKKDKQVPGISADNTFRSLKSWLNKGTSNEIEQSAAYSYQEMLSKKDFSAIPADEVDELIRIIKEISRRLANRINRRYERSNKINVPDPGRTLRRNLRRGGELIELEFRKQKRTRSNLLIFCDVSKSMDLYSVFLIQFMFAFQQVYKQQEVFTFGTSLERITPYLKQNDFKTVLSSLKGQADSWSGGTRIGESLDTFIKVHAQSTLKRGTIIIILSDGWDTGETQLLQRTMQHLHSRAKKIIWLNPLAGNSSYRPLTAGMQAAMPFIDVFASVHNAESLRSLAKWL